MQGNRKVPNYRVALWFYSKHGYDAPAKNVTLGWLEEICCSGKV